jgi:hypothetical protein
MQIFKAVTVITVTAIAFFWSFMRNPAIKPLALTNDHGRYIAVTPERILVSVEEWPLNTRIAVINLELSRF